MKRTALTIVLTVAALLGPVGAPECLGGRAAYAASPRAPFPSDLSGLPARADRFALPLERMRSEYLGISTRLAPEAITTLNAQGEWPDVVYEDRSVGVWKPMLHLDRVRAMAAAYSASDGRYSKSPSVRDDIIRALRAWLRRAPQSDNWWHNTIGVQLGLMPVLVLMDDELPDDLRSALLATFVSLASVPADRKTGQNLIWYATQHIVKGVLTRNGAEISIGLDAVRSTLTITTAEGLQADLSFHQHGSQLYSGGYGLAFLGDVVRLAAWFQGTEWQLPRVELNLLADFATAGIGPLVWGHWLDWSARGREITRQPSRPQTDVLRVPVDRLLALAPDRRPALTELRERLMTKARPNQVRTHGYWRSDFLVHQTPHGYFSVKMVSRRTTGTESGNGENLLGYWLPFGTTFILGRGDGNEYLGLQPVLDWSALPGITAPRMVPRFGGYLRHSEDNVAVLSSDTTGMASMRVNTQGLQAQKFWFFDGNVMVALGASIRYKGAEDVRTTINQTRWTGSCQSSNARNGESAALCDQDKRSVTWLTHGGVGYTTLDNQRMVMRVDERKLQGRDPTTTVNGADPNRGRVEQVLTLSVDHGVHPQDASYAYAVAHGIEQPDQLLNLALPKVLANTSSVQGASSADGSRFSVVLHRPGQVGLGRGVTLQADKAVAVLGQFDGDGMELRVIDPAGSGATVTVSAIRDGHMLDQKTVTTPANSQRNLTKPSASVSLNLAR